MTERNYRTYLLAVLLILLTATSTDSLVLGLSLQNIKLDLSVSDTELGLLSGIAFAFFYGVMGIPIGRWADRGDRVRIIAITTAIWAIAVALCGIAGNFLQLVLIRVGVAVGEAGCVPPAHSLIADYFTRAERPRAVAIYMLGWPLSVVLGNLLAGWLIELYGWRMTFMMFGAPGLGLAALAGFTLREPRRSKLRVDAAVNATAPSECKERSLSLLAPSLKEVSVALWANRTFRHLLLCFAVGNFFGWGIGQWLPAFFVRSYGLETGKLGTLFAVLWGTGGLLGTYLGGEWASRRAAGDERRQLKAMAVAYCCFAIITAGVYLSYNQYVALGFLACTSVGMYSVSGPMFAAIQTLIPERMRGVSIALVYLFANLIGMGFGPLVVGALSDVLRPFFGQESLRYALLTLCPGFFWSAWHALRASKTVGHDLAQLRMDPIRGTFEKQGGEEYRDSAVVDRW
jgi:MFS family permease